MKDDELLLEVLEVSRMHLEDAGGDPEKAKADLRQGLKNCRIVNPKTEALFSRGIDLVAARKGGISL